MTGARLANRSVGTDALNTPITAHITGAGDEDVEDRVAQLLPLQAPSGFSTYNTGGFFDPAEPDFVAAPKDGLYRLTATVSFTQDPDGFRSMLIVSFGETFDSPGTISRHAAAPTGDTVIGGTVQVAARAGDDFGVRAYQGSGETLPCRIESLDITYLGPLPGS